MPGFTKEEKVRFRYRKYVKEHVFDFFIRLALHTALTEAVVYLCGGTKYLTGFILALGYTVGHWLVALYCYKKEWLEIDIAGKAE